MTKRRGKSQAERKLKARASANESQAKRKRQIFCRFDEFVILSDSEVSKTFHIVILSFRKKAKYPKTIYIVILGFRKKAKYPHKTHGEWIKNRALKRKLCGYFANANMTIWIFRYAQNDKIYRSIETKIAKI